MTSLADHGVIRTSAVDRVVAPISAQLCHLVLLCESGAEEQFTLLEGAAQAVAMATRNMATEVSRRAAESDDDTMRAEMLSLVEPITMSGQHVLLAAQRLSIQPRLADHREELIIATQNVLLGVVKALLVEDDAAVRKVVSAADWVLESLSELGSCRDLPSLLRSFQSFSEGLMLLHGLVQERAVALQDPGQAQVLLDSLETLRKCISMLHTAMVTTIRHPSSLQAQEARRYILEKLESTVNDIITTLRSEGPRDTPGACGFYTERRERLLQLLATPSSSSFSSSFSSFSSSPAKDRGQPSSRGSDLDSVLRDLVLHCMEVASISRRDSQHRVVDHCRHVLQLWAHRARLVKLTKLPQDSHDDDEYYNDEDESHYDDEDKRQRQVESVSGALTQQIQLLDEAMVTASLQQVLDSFVEAAAPYEYLMETAGRAMDREPPGESGGPGDQPGGPVSCLQSSLEDFLSQADRILQVAGFISAFAADAKSLEGVENSRTCLTRLRVGLAALSLELDSQSEQSVEAVQNLVGLCQRWGEESNQLQEAFYDVIKVRQFTSLAVGEMAVARRVCDAAYREQSPAQFMEHARRLTSYLGQVLCCVKRHVDRSDSPIYRNGLLVLLRQAEVSLTRVSGSVTDMVSGASLNTEAFSTFSQNISMAIQQMKVLREGLDGQQHPHLLSPLRAEARQAQVPTEPPPERPAPGLARSVDSTGPHLSALEVEQSKGSVAEPKEEDFKEVDLQPPPRPPKHTKAVIIKAPAVLKEPKQIPNKPSDVDLLPLLYNVVTVTREKDVSILNRQCTAVLELSNCYAQAAREASVLVGAVDGQTLDILRAELVSLTPLLVQTAQETAMSSARSTDSIYRHSTMFTDLINNMQKVLLPVAGAWYHAISSTLQNNSANPSAHTVAQQLGDVMSLCADVVQLLTSSDIPMRGNCQESFTMLHSKLNKAHNRSRLLAEQSSSQTSQADLLEGPGLLWALSLQVLLSSLDNILGSPGGGPMEPLRQLTPQKKLAAMSENSLRIQEAARLTCLNCINSNRVKVLSELQDQLKTLTETYLQATDDLSLMSGVLQLAQSEFLHRQLLINLRVLSGLLDKQNKEYVTEIQHIVNLAHSAAQHHRDDGRMEAVERQFEKAADLLFKNVNAATKQVQDCFNYLRDPRARSSLRSISDHLSFQISDIVSKARLMVESRCVFDHLDLQVQVQCWAAKAHYVAQEIWKLDGIHQEVKERVRMGLQGRAPCSDPPRDAVPVKTESLPAVREMKEASDRTAVMTQPRHSPEVSETVETNMNVFAASSPEPAVEKSQTVERVSPHAGPSGGTWGLRDDPSLTYTSLFLRQEMDRWDSKGNRIVQVTREMADKIYHMAQYLRRKGPIPNKEVFVNTAKGVVSNCQSVTQFVRVIADHCLEQQSSAELSLILEQILTVTNQLTIISSVNALTPGSKSSDEILVKNAQNLLQIVLQGVHAAETACIKGLRQPEPGSDAVEAAALCFQWRRKLQLHRAQQQSSPDTDDLGLRRTAAHPGPPSLAPSLAHP